MWARSPPVQAPAKRRPGRGIPPTRCATAACGDAGDAAAEAAAEAAAGAASGASPDSQPPPSRRTPRPQPPSSQTASPAARARATEAIASPEPNGEEFEPFADEGDAAAAARMPAIAAKARAARGTATGGGASSAGGGSRGGNETGVRVLAAGANATSGYPFLAHFSSVIAEAESAISSVEPDTPAHAPAPPRSQPPRTPLLLAPAMGEGADEATTSMAVTRPKPKPRARPKRASQSLVAALGDDLHRYVPEVDDDEDDDDDDDEDGDDDHGPIGGYDDGANGASSGAGGRGVACRSEGTSVGGVSAGGLGPNDEAALERLSPSLWRRAGSPRVEGAGGSRHAEEEERALARGVPTMRSPSYVAAAARSLMHRTASRPRRAPAPALRASAQAKNGS